MVLGEFLRHLRTGTLEKAGPSSAPPIICGSGESGQPILLTPMQIENIHFDGLTPVIMNIQMNPNLKLLLGVGEKSIQTSRRDNKTTINRLGLCKTDHFLSFTLADRIPLNTQNRARGRSEKRMRLSDTDNHHLISKYVFTS